MSKPAKPKLEVVPDPPKRGRKPAARPKVVPAARRGRGRPSKLTADTTDAVYQALKLGNYAQIACKVAGISEASYHAWRARGQTELDRQDRGEKARPSEALFLDFLEATKKGEAEAENRAVLMVQNAMPTNWQAAMTYLERRFPDRWGRRDRREITGAEGGPIRVDTMTDTERADAMREVRDELDRRLHLAEADGA